MTLRLEVAGPDGAASREREPFAHLLTNKYSENLLIAA